MKNPWPGLASYTEESLKDYQFNGRSAASATLSALIRRNLFVTLYGRSGIGKTSLLQAGVYPMLRGDGLSPVTIRLNEFKDKHSDKEDKEDKKEDSKEAGNDNAPAAAQILWEKLLAELHESGVQYLPCDDNDKYNPVFTDVMVLRSLFSAGRFKNAENEDITPVIVLDQFEEILYKSPAAARLLVSQLYALIDDNYDLTIPHPTWHEDTIFRIVVSIREDDLFLFEDCIDTLNCVDFKSNRYRLMPLSVEEAKEVILNPAAGMFKEEQETDIVDRIISISRSQGDSINTLMLSLLCHVLYDKYAVKGEPIKLSDLSDYDDIIRVYYQSVLKEKKLLKANGKPISDIAWLEDNLVDEQGRRKSVYLSDFKKNAPKAKDLADNNNDHDNKNGKDNDGDKDNNTHRLLNISQGRVEFIHDQLAASVFELRNSRKAIRYRRNGIIIMSVVLALVFVCAFTTIPETRKLKEYESSKELINLANNTIVKEYSIEDSITSYDYTYVISDCPNLKKINIRKRNANLRLYHCPSLVEIEIPNNYKGHITAYNCPNLRENDFLESLEDSSSNVRENESELGGVEGKGYYSHDIEEIVRDSFVVTYEYLPYYIDLYSYTLSNSKQQFKVRTNLSDEAKSIIDCKVPWGYYDRFSQLREFQAFRSLEQMDMLTTIWNRLKGAYHIYESYGIWYYISIYILEILFFLLIAHYNKELNNRILLIRIFLSLFYSFITISVCLLAWLSFYWLSFNMIFYVTPYLLNLILSNIIAGIAALLCLGIILKPNFWTWLKNSIVNGCRRLRYFTLGENVKYLLLGVKKTVSRLWVSIKRLKWIYLSLLLIAVGGSIAYMEYQDGKNSRERYLEELEMLDIAKIPTIIDALEKQHGCFLYPFFTERLNNLKQEINKKLTRPYFCITPENLNYIAASNKINLSATEINDAFYTISNDGCGLCIRVKNNYTGLEQMVYYDFLRERLDTMTSRCDEFYYKSKFSQTGKTLICYSSSDDHGFIYNVNTRKLKKTSDNFPYDEDVSLNDNDYYYLKGNALYKGNLYSNSEPSEVRDFDKNFENYFDYIHIIDSENILIWNAWYGRICYVYNLKQNSIIYSPKEHNSRIIGSVVRGINSEYVVSDKGVYDFKQDSLIVDSYGDMYMWNNRLIKISKDDDKFVLQDINGKEIKTIYRESNDDSSSFLFNDNYICTISNNYIFIYPLGAKLNRRVKITDYDKKVFDLE